MHFFTVSYHLDEKYFVSTRAFEDVIAKVFQSIQKSTLVSSNVKIQELTNEVFINLSVKGKEKTKLEDVIKEIESKVNDGVLNLIDTKPSNITIEFAGGINNDKKSYAPRKRLSFGQNAKN